MKGGQLKRPADQQVLFAATKRTRQQPPPKLATIIAPWYPPYPVSEERDYRPATTQTKKSSKRRRGHKRLKVSAKCQRFYRSVVPKFKSRPPSYVIRKLERIRVDHRQRLTVSKRSVRHVTSRHVGFVNARRQERETGMLPSYFKNVAFMVKAVQVCVSRPWKRIVEHFGCSMIGQNKVAEPMRSLYIKKFKDLIGYSGSYGGRHFVSQPCYHVFIVLEENRLVTAYPITLQNALSAKRRLMLNQTLNSTASTLNFTVNDDSGLGNSTLEIG